jgi:uncharacterized SAM-binding protein YcdF (DUF218 family)
MKKTTNGRWKTAVKIRAFDVIIIISILLIAVGIVGNSLFPWIK